MDQWFYTLKHLSRMKEMSKYLDPKIIGRMFDIGRIGNLNKEQLMEYQASMKDKMDLEAAFSGAMKQGREQGRKEGREEGRKEGRKEGKMEGKRDFVRNLILEFDMSDKEIAKATSQSPASVREMRRSIEQESRE